MSSYPPNLHMGGQSMYHPSMVQTGMPGPMASMTPGTPMHTMSTLSSIPGTPMEVMQSDPMQTGPEDIAMSQPVVESIEELRIKYKQELIRLEVLMYYYIIGFIIYYCGRTVLGDSK